MNRANRVSGAGEVSADLVDAALQAAHDLGKDVAEVPLVAIAERAGVSRSTLLRRLGGTRAPLDDAVRAAGVDPGGQRPVRERAVEAGGYLIGEHGLAAVTLESVASAAECSVYSLYASFGGRSGLLRAIFERYRPVLDLDENTELGADLIPAVTEIYRRIAREWTREPRIIPAIFAEILARPNDPTVQELAEHIIPRSPVFGVIDWLGAQVSAGRIRDLPRLLLLQQLVAPLMLHILLRPVVERTPDLESPELDETCVVLAANFVRAVGVGS